MTQQLALDGLTKSYPDGTTTRVVLDAVDLTVDAGELVAIMGPSGSGKSTLLHLVAGLDRPDSGQIKVGATFLSALSGAELAELRRTAVGYVEQRLNLIAVLSAVENVMLPLELGGMSARAARQQAMAALEAVGLADLADRDAERYAQVGMTLELTDAKAGDLLKAYMPAIRNNILLVLAGKTAGELMEHEGKVKLATEVRAAALKPLGYAATPPAPHPPEGGKKDGHDDEPPVRAVHFSNFIIQ